MVFPQGVFLNTERPNPKVQSFFRTNKWYAIRSPSSEFAQEPNQPDPLARSRIDSILNTLRRYLLGTLFVLGLNPTAEGQVVSLESRNRPSMELVESMDRRLSTRSYSTKNVEYEKLSWILWAIGKTWGSQTPGGFVLVQIESDTYVYRPAEHVLEPYSGPFPVLRTYSAPVQLAIMERDSISQEQREKLFFLRGMAGQAVYLGSSAMGLGTVTIGGIGFPIGYPSSSTNFQIDRDAEESLRNLNTETPLSLNQSFNEWGEATRVSGDLTEEMIARIFWSMYGRSRLKDENQRIHRTVPSAHGRYPMTVLGLTPDGCYRYNPEDHRIIREDQTINLTGLADSLGIDWVQHAHYIFFITWDAEIIPQRTLAMYEAGSMVANTSLMCAAHGLPLEWRFIPVGKNLPDLDPLLKGNNPFGILGIVENDPSEQSEWRDGSFIGECLEWPRMKVEVTVKGGAIDRIEIIDDFGTLEFSALAKAAIPSRIIEQGIVEVDGVSGATMSSASLKKAVAGALKKAR